MILSRWRLQLLRWSKRLWVRVAFIALLSIASALAAQVFAPFLPADIAWKLGAGAVGKILEILASSLLTIATFSLGTLIASYSAASSSTTPRITSLLLQDSSAQNALATFIGGFLFSLSGIIGLSAGMYSDSGKLMLFFTTLVVIGAIITTFLQWIDRLPRLGRVEDAIKKVSAVAVKSMEDHQIHPYLGDRALRPDQAPN